jgi:putative FmdB family regulatory protein
MPTYEYRCENGHLFEEFQRMSAPPIEVCPQCGTKAERLLSSGVGILFKGSGFYITDYRSDSYKKAAEADKSTSGEAKSDSASKSSSDTPAPKPSSESTATKKVDGGSGSGSTSD